jgi:hypothetical protein
LPPLSYKKGAGQMEDPLPFSFLNSSHRKIKKKGGVIASSSVVDILKIGKKAGYKIIANTFNNKNPED